jgi:hypothetical protein
MSQSESQVTLVDSDVIAEYDRGTGTGTDLTNHAHEYGHKHEYENEHGPEKSQADVLTTTVEERVLQYQKSKSKSKETDDTQSDANPNFTPKSEMTVPVLSDTHRYRHEYRLRRQGSLELQVGEIEDEESRRLTAIAFLV